MDTSTLALAAMALVFVVAALHSRKLREDRRDIAVLGVSGALCGVAAAATAMI